ncbi:MAG: hypothetical protein U0736_11680 [Gemmataceae bacterium]
MVLTANSRVSRIFIGQTQPIVGFNPGAVVANGLAANAVVTPTPITSLQGHRHHLADHPEHQRRPHRLAADHPAELQRATQRRQHLISPTPAGFTNIPINIVQRRLFSGTIVAKDSTTVAIGGLIEEA